MKFLVALALTILAVGVMALTPDQKGSLHTTNLHHIGSLDPLAQTCLEQLLQALELHENYVRFGNGISNGHSVMYEFVEGSNPNLIKELAPKYKLKVESSTQCTCNNCCGRILLPGANVVAAVPVPGQRQGRSGLAPTLEGPALPTNGPPSPTAAHIRNQKMTERGVTDDQRQWYYDNNVAQITKMDPKAQLFMRDLLDRLHRHAPDLIMQFMAPVPNGHAVRFDLVRGNLSTIESFAAKCKCGVKVHKHSLVVPDTDVVLKNAEPNAEAKNGHLEVEHVEEDPDGAPQPVTVVPRDKRDITKKLPHKWIADDVKFLETDDEAHHTDEEEDIDDAFIQEVLDDDDEEEVDAFLLESL